jgi:hypothetical protein
MAFSDDLARDPKSEKEFWAIIEDTFVQVEGVLFGYRVETKEEALTGALRIRDEGDTYRSSPGDFIRYRGVDEDYDSRDYFLNLGRKFVPRVERQIRCRRLTPQFAKDWGVVMMCHGFVSAHILDDSDGLSHFRAGRKSGKTRSKHPQKKWVARQILAIMEAGLARGQADARLGTRIVELIDKKKFPQGFNKEWFASMLDKHRALRDAYSQKRLSQSELKSLASEPNDDIPPINFSR